MGLCIETESPARCRCGTASESSVKPCSSFFRNPLATRDRQTGGGELVVAEKASTRWLSQSGQPAGRSLRVFSGAVAISLTVVASTDAGSMESEFILGCVFVLPPLLLLTVKLRKCTETEALHRPRVGSSDWSAKKP